MRQNSTRRGIRTAQAGLLVNTLLAVVKLVAGLLGNAYALVADAVESTADVFSSLIVWGGLRIAAREADEDYPFGYGKAEALAAAVVAVMLIGAALAITIEAIEQIRRPHSAPAPWTLAVLGVVIVVKEVLFRHVARVAAETDSTAVHADAWHHRADAITSAAAFVGIALAVWKGDRWAAADDWAALVAAVVILANGIRLMRPAVHDLMDRAPEGPLVEVIARAATGTPGVRAIEKLKVRRTGTGFYVDIHVQADPAMTLHDAHELSGVVKGAIRQAAPAVLGVLIHMEPHEPLAVEGG